MQIERVETRDGERLKKTDREEEEEEEGEGKGKQASRNRIKTYISNPLTQIHTAGTSSLCVCCPSVFECGGKDGREAEWPRVVLAARGHVLGMVSKSI